MHKLRTIISGLLVCAVAAIGRVSAQEAATSTPVPISLSTAAPADAGSPAPLVGTATDTPQAQIQLEARDFANVRAQPDPESSDLGDLRAGDLYNVIGRYGLWYQFQFDPSPNGVGWVFGDLVTITGDPSLIPEIDLAGEPTVDPNALGLTATAQSVTQTPGGLLTATAAARAQSALAGSGAQITPPGLLPTFTYPPNAALAPSDLSTAGVQPAATETTEPLEAVESAPIAGMPPILPIAALLGLGIIGLGLGSIRRG